MGNERAEELIRKYLDGTATPEEVALLESWYIMAAQEQPQMSGAPDYEKIKEEILQPLLAEQEERAAKVRPMRIWPRVVAAASILGVVALGAVYIFRERSKPPVDVAAAAGNVLLPAGVKAELELVDGKIISLDSVDRPALARQGDVVIGSQNGQLVYTAGGAAVSPGAMTAGGDGHNLLTTRPGEHYSLVLPDGTKVWLNAASSIRYPVTFNGGARVVSVKGEAYFEVVHDARQPLRIIVGSQTIEDIGTHFDISAYDDEPVVRTTLLEGSVKVMKGAAAAVLKPGQEAVMGAGDVAFRVKDGDVDAAVAWKAGYFSFDRADLKTVMREFARWYDLQIVYQGELPKRTFKGKVYRNIPASEALHILSYFGARFRIEGRTITVSS
jgi:transmembrane sensor